AGGKIEELDAELTTGLLELHDHALGERVAEWAQPRVRRHDVVDGREGLLRVGDAELQIAEHAEGLRAGYLVEQVQTDENLGLASGQDLHQVLVPNFLKQAFSHVAPSRMAKPIESRAGLGAPGRCQRSPMLTRLDD